MAPGRKSKLGVVVMVVVMTSLLPPMVSAQSGSRVVFPTEECVDGNRRCAARATIQSCETDTYTKNVCCETCQALKLSAPDPLDVNVVPDTTLGTPAASDSRADEATSRPQAPRRSIVNPNFECGGASPRSPSRRARQAPTEQGLHRESPQFTTVAPPSSEGASNTPVFASCGASVISERFLVTAASCIDSNNPISSVRLGDIDLAVEGENNSAPIDYDIEQIIVFPRNESLPPNHYNDIALLKTYDEIQFNEAVFPYCISDKKPDPGTTVIVSGFGHYNETHKSTHVLEGELTVIPINQCEQQHLLKDEQRLRKAFPNLLQNIPGLLCAGDVKTGVCEGDEGGPLFREDEQGRRFLEGITSFTDSKCGEGLLPGLFTAVADYVPFIDHTLYGGGEKLP